MKILLIDNYDSFTFNLVNQIKRVTGSTIVVKRNRDDSIFEQDYDALVLSPGPMSPQQSGHCVSLLKKNRKPVLGVCLGMQVLCELGGGKTTHSEFPLHGQVEKITFSETPLFQGIENGIFMRYNSLRCDLSDSDYLVSSYVHQEPMSIELGNRVGVQFHPESFLSIDGDQLVHNFFEYYCT